MPSPVDARTFESAHRSGLIDDGTNQLSAHMTIETASDSLELEGIITPEQVRPVQSLNRYIGLQNGIRPQSRPYDFHDPGLTAYILALADLDFGNSVAVLQNDRFLERDDVVLLSLSNLSISLSM
jgi:hypothetical protein